MKAFARRGQRGIGWVALAWLQAACASPAPPSTQAPQGVRGASTALRTTAAQAFVPVASESLRFTAGAMTDGEGPGTWSIDSPGVRVDVAGRHRAIEVQFRYRGPSKSEEALASGELRRQIGLRLRAQDTCNVAYVMWEIEPKPGLRVSVKRNPGQTRHRDCGDRGYSFVSPRWQRLFPAETRPGERHALRAWLLGRSLFVSADGRLVWAGDLPAELLQFDGPAGLRSDNGEFELSLLVGDDARPEPTLPPNLQEE